MGHFIEVEKGVKLFAEDIGEGQPVVFLHGWPVNHKMFEYQLNELPEKGYRFIGIDLRGYGKSDRTKDGYDYDTMADDVKAVIDDLKLDNVVLAGFSMGGPIAVRYMARHEGHKVSKLMLLAAAAPLFTQRDDYPYGLSMEETDDIITNLQTDRPAMLAEFGKMFFESELSEEFKAWFHDLGLEASSYATIKSAEALRDEDGRSDLAKVNVPTAIFHGKKDQICPFEFTEAMSEGIQYSFVIPFENSGHGLFFDEKEKFNSELLRFLEQ
ncbi:alpha/beta fold hydrolase [Metabacillus idriensis]|uniref:alpha/beta fold hydrolase n=1 Tax=Metabacillus idriensis TaxID=324768 RepID=UPI003D2D130B